MLKYKKKSVLDIQLGGVSLVDKALFAKQLSVMLHSGLPLIEALDIASQSSRSKLSGVLRGVSESVMSGHTLADSFSRYPKIFSGLFVSATRAGELSGTLVGNLENISVQLEKEKDLIAKVKGALVYPVVILIATFILGMILSFVILPKITPLFEGLRVELPTTTKALIAFSHFIENNGLIFFLSIIVFFTFTIWLVRQSFTKPFTHWFLLHTPIIGRITMNANLARFSRTLGMLLKSGLRIDESLEITENTVGNFYYARALKRVSRNIRSGSKLSDNLATFNNLFPVLATRMIQVGEESGQFEKTLFYLASYYEDEVDTATKALSTAIEPLLLLFIGLVVGFLALSIITPIYDITGNIQR
ncbi:type II secretion system F family protein [Patescibacteria group bacterium]|nr:type II secretion system F family protein [Patescibacteria group bacterium]